MNWTNELDRFAIDLRDKGYSCAQVANEISARFYIWITRNAVIGRFNRIDASPEQKALWAAARRKLDSERPCRYRRPRQRAVTRKTNLNVNRLFPTTKPEIAVAAAPDWIGISLFDLANHTCRFPSNDKPFLYCGDPTADLSNGRPYCPFHHSIATVIYDHRSRTITGKAQARAGSGDNFHRAMPELPVATPDPVRCGRGGNGVVLDPGRTVAGDPSYAVFDAGRSEPADGVVANERPA